MTLTAQAARQSLRRLASPQKTAVLRRFFKTGPGEYAEGDQFLGIMVPDTRRVAKAYAELSLPEIEILLNSPIHEERFLGLLILSNQYRTRPKDRSVLFAFLWKHKRAMNNWDLVDVICPRIIGAHLESRSRTRLFTLARSRNLWDRRIAIVSTLWFIVKGDASTTLQIAEMLLRDPHDLIHKATGWMLREVGKHCAPGTLEAFLDRHAAHMPRTMLRYAIERFPQKKRLSYLVHRSSS